MFQTPTVFYALLVIQALLMVVVVFGAYLVKKRKKWTRHCTLMRWAVPLQVIITLFIMVPSMANFLRLGQGGPLFITEMLAHHTLGVAVIVLWVIINLLMKRRGKIRPKFIALMRAALLAWFAAFFMGLHLFYIIWL